jgi:hypothetical protein
MWEPHVHLVNELTGDFGNWLGAMLCGLSKCLGKPVRPLHNAEVPDLSIIMDRGLDVVLMLGPH